MQQETNIDNRLDAVEDRLQRLESLLLQMSEKLDQNLQPAATSASPNEEEKAEALKNWVTDYVSMRLHQLVPETCEHPDEELQGDGPFLGNSNIRCTEEVIHRTKRIPIPFVREMVIQRVIEHAQRDEMELVDVDYFEKTATF